MLETLSHPLHQRGDHCTGVANPSRMPVEHSYDAEAAYWKSIQGLTVTFFCRGRWEDDLGVDCGDFTPASVH